MENIKKYRRNWKFLFIFVIRTILGNVKPIIYKIQSIMKIFFYSLCIAICLCACHSSETMNGNIFQVDVKDSHSSIQLQLDDVAEVKYIKLANDSDFLVRTKPLVCSDNYILTKGGNTGEILIFDKTGKAISRFSHAGNGPHEYNYITNLLLDEKRKEIYVHDVFLQKMLVYDMKGTFVREYTMGDARFIYSFDDVCFLVYNTITNQTSTELKPSFTLVSKTDGKVLQTINVPFASDKKFDLAVTKSNNGESFTYTAMHLPIIRCSDGYLLNELSSDTIYTLSLTKELKPFIARVPSISDMSAPIFLQGGPETDRFIFLTKVSVNENDVKNMFPTTDWVYDKSTGSISEYKIVNEDYPSKEFTLTSHNVNCDMPFGYGISRYRAYKLVEAYKEGELHGRLKEIAATLQEEDNDVLVLYKFK